MWSGTKNGVETLRGKKMTANKLKRTSIQLSDDDLIWLKITANQFININRSTLIRSAIRLLKSLDKVELEKTLVRKA